MQFIFSLCTLIYIEQNVADELEVLSLNLLILKTMYHL